MKRIYHASGSVVTGADLAEALLQYAIVLANRQQSDVVDIPILDESGKLTRGVILLGVGAQFVSVPADLDMPEIVDQVTLDLLRERTRDTPGYQAWDFDAADMAMVDEFSY